MQRLIDFEVFVKARRFVPKFKLGGPGTKLSTVRTTVENSWVSTVTIVISRCEQVHPWQARGSTQALPLNTTLNSGFSTEGLRERR